MRANLLNNNLNDRFIVARANPFCHWCSFASDQAAAVTQLRVSCRLTLHMSSISSWDSLEIRQSRRMNKRKFIWNINKERIGIALNAPQRKCPCSSSSGEQQQRICTTTIAPWLVFGTMVQQREIGVWNEMFRESHSLNEASWGVERSRA